MLNILRNEFIDKDIGGRILCYLKKLEILYANN